jgi:hypothetical protein
MTRANGATAVLDAPDAAALLETADAEHHALLADTAPAPADDAAPKRTRAPRTRKPRTDRAPRSRARSSKPALRPQLESLIAGIGLTVSVFHAADGTAIMEGAAAQAHALDQLARNNANVERVLRSLCETSAYGALAMAFTPTVLRILANHNKVPPMVGMMATAMAPAPPPADTPPDAARNNATGAPAPVVA